MPDFGAPAGCELCYFVLITVVFEGDVTLNLRVGTALPKRHAKIVFTAVIALLSLCGAGMLRASEAEQAVKQLRKQVKADPSNADLHYKLAQALSEFGRFELQRAGRTGADPVFSEAIAEYNKTIELQPANVEARKSLASELTFKGKFAEARAQLREIAKLSPDDASAHLALARADLHDEGGDLNESIAELHAALEKDPASSGAWNDLGEAQMKLGKFEDAAASYREALKASPDDDTGHYYLAEALKRAGHLDDAVAEYREALRRNGQWKDMLTTILAADLQAKNLAFAQSDAQVLEKLGYPVDPQMLAQLKSLEEASK
jgi:protein O-GlcNAc transferase